MLGSESIEADAQAAEFCNVYRDYYPQVFRYMRRRTDEESALDATADTFLVAWRRLEDLPEGDSILPWLYGVARRVLSNQRRGQRRWRALSSRVAAATSTSVPSVEATVVPEDHVQTVLDAMARLRPGDREVLQLAQWEELSHAEIGIALGCSAHAVDQRMHRAMSRLRSELPLDWMAPGSNGEGGSR